MVILRNCAPNVVILRNYAPNVVTLRNCTPNVVILRNYAPSVVILRNYAPIVVILRNYAPNVVILKNCAPNVVILRNCTPNVVILRNYAPNVVILRNYAPNVVILRNYAPNALCREGLILCHIFLLIPWHLAHIGGKSRETSVSVAKKIARLNLFSKCGYRFVGTLYWPTVSSGFQSRPQETLATLAQKQLLSKLPDSLHQLNLIQNPQSVQNVAS